MTATSNGMTGSISTPPGPHDLGSGGFVSSIQSAVDRRTLREVMLQDATRIVVGDRDKQYSGPEDSFKVIASFWSVYLSKRIGNDVQISPDDVAAMMTLLKTARLATGGTRQKDTWTDIAGYAACGYEVSERHVAPQTYVAEG